MLPCHDGEIKLCKIHAFTFTIRGWKTNGKNILVLLEALETNRQTHGRKVFYCSNIMNYHSTHHPSFNNRFLSEPGFSSSQTEILAENRLSIIGWMPKRLRNLIIIIIIINYNYNYILQFEIKLYQTLENYTSAISKS